MLRYLTKIKRCQKNGDRNSYITVAVFTVVCTAIFMTMPVSALPETAVDLPTVIDITPTPISVVGSALTPPDDTPSDDSQQELDLPPSMLPHMELLYNENNDLAGWLKIDGTILDYPVMYTPDDPGFYLYRTFEKKDDPTEQGTLFIDENCTIDPRSVNLLIHGHNMKNGTMFSTLLKYKDEDFFKEHPTIEYSTLYETFEYEIVAVFLSKIYRKTDTAFKYYQFYDAQTEDELNYFIDNVKKLQLYETGVTASFGDMLITLSTCEYSQENGRLVVVGRRIHE